jgi:non-ribosomal peptide synthetase component F
MAAASAFWLDGLRDCEIDRPLPLPFDRRRVSDGHRTGRGTSVSFIFDKVLSQGFLTYASTSNTKPEHLALASYYAFLFKLTNGERDLCVGMNTHGRYTTELRSVIGMFVNAIPLRCQINPHWSFAQLVEHVHVMATRSLEYSYFPLQRILAQHPLASQPAFLDTSFEFCSAASQGSYGQVTLGGVPIRAEPFSIEIGTDEIVSKFDFSLNVQLDPATGQLSCTINASLDLFDPVTMSTIEQRFLLVLKQLFESNANWAAQPIYELSLMLPDEALLIQSINNTEVAFPAADCVHHEFARQASEQPQKVAVELDKQSLTYSELLFYVQRLALHLLVNYDLTPGDIICQCIERSLSMVNYFE